MVFSLTGYLLLNIIMLLNSVCFYQLQVEFLLLECLQDMTGGVPWDWDGSGVGGSAVSRILHTGKQKTGNLWRALR